MAKNLRLNDQEELMLKTKAIELNKQLSKMGMDSIKDTELCHIIIEQTAKNGILEISKDGKVKVISEYSINKQ